MSDVERAEATVRLDGMETKEREAKKLENSTRIRAQEMVEEQQKTVLTAASNTNNKTRKALLNRTLSRLQESGDAVAATSVPSNTSAIVKKGKKRAFGTEHAVEVKKSIKKAKEVFVPPLKNGEPCPGCNSVKAGTLDAVRDVKKTTKDAVKSMEEATEYAADAVSRMFGMATTGASDPEENSVGSTGSTGATGATASTGTTGATGATASTGATGATGATASTGAADSLTLNLDGALNKLVNGRGSIRRKAGVSIIEGLRAGAEAENEKAERELKDSMAKDLAANLAAKAAAKVRLVRHLKALKVLHGVNMAKAAKKLLQAKNMLANLTDSIAPLRERLASMGKSLEYAKEKGLSSAEDGDLMKPVKFKIKTLEVQIGKVAPVVKSAKVAYEVAKSKFDATVKELLANQPPTGATGMSTGATGTSTGATGTPTGANDVPTEATGASTGPAESSSGATGSSTGSTGATGANIPDNIAETGSTDVPNPTGPTGMFSGKITMPSLTEQHRDHVYEQFYNKKRN